eukprot:8720791-Prorocentrum_lima.AAC.1
MTSSLVGSEMCIRDSGLPCTIPLEGLPGSEGAEACCAAGLESVPHCGCACLLYTSDAADDM